MAYFYRIEQLYWKHYRRNPFRVIRFAFSKKVYREYMIMICELHVQAASMLEAVDHMPMRNSMAKVTIENDVANIFDGYNPARLAQEMQKRTTEAREWIKTNKKQLQNKDQK